MEQIGIGPDGNLFCAICLDEVPYLSANRAFRFMPRICKACGKESVFGYTDSDDDFYCRECAEGTAADALAMLTPYGLSPTGDPRAEELEVENDRSDTDQPDLRHESKDEPATEPETEAGIPDEEEATKPAPDDPDAKQPEVGDATTPPDLVEDDDFTEAGSL